MNIIFLIMDVSIRGAGFIQCEDSNIERLLKTIEPAELCPVTVLEYCNLQRDWKNYMTEYSAEIYIRFLYLFH